MQIQENQEISKPSSNWDETLQNSDYPIRPSYNLHLRPQKVSLKLRASK